MSVAVGILSALLAIFVLEPWLFRDSPYAEGIAALVLAIVGAYLIAVAREREASREFRRRWPGHWK